MSRGCLGLLLVCSFSASAATIDFTRHLAQYPRHADQSQASIVGLGHVNINVSDFERSRAWYQMLGYESRLGRS